MLGDGRDFLETPLDERPSAHEPPRRVRGIGKDEECAKDLKKRTLTNLYNQRPTWLDLAHRRLDAAVFAAYGWDASMTDDELLAALLELNQQRAR